MRLALSILTSFFSLVALAAAATADPVTYFIDDQFSSASVTVELDGNAIGGGTFDVTGTFVTFDDMAPSLTDLEIAGNSVNTIVLSEAVNVGLGLVDSVFVDSATMVDAGAFTTGTLVPGIIYESTGPIFVSSSLTTNLGPAAFGFVNTLEASPIIITQDILGVSLEMFGFTLASFDVIDSGGNFIEDGLTIKLDLSVVAKPIPEPSAAVLYLLSLAVVSPFVRRARLA